MQTICTITLVYGVSFAKLTVQMFTCAVCVMCKQPSTFYAVYETPHRLHRHQIWPEQARNVRVRVRLSDSTWSYIWCRCGQCSRCGVSWHPIL